MSAPLSYNATLLSRHLLTDDVGLFRVAPDVLPSGEEPWFVPGQYVTIGVNPASGEPVRRPMTIASASTQRHEIEFYLNRVAMPRSQNPLTHLLWQLSTGDRFYLRSHPTGRFTIADTVGINDGRVRVCIGQGTGAAPFVSMIRSCDGTDDKLDRYALIHGAETPEHLAFHDEMVEFARRGICYIPVTRTAWSGIQGCCSDLVRDDHIEMLESLLGLGRGAFGPERVVIYVCGLKPVIADSIENLLTRGFVPHHRKIRRALGITDAVQPSLFIEQYDTERIVDINDAMVVERLQSRFKRAGGAV